MTRTRTVIAPAVTMIALLATLLLSLGVTSSLAHADVYPLPTTGQGTVDHTTVHPGDCVNFSGGGFRPGTVVTIKDNGKIVGTTRADSQGKFKYRYCFPLDSSLGRHHLTAEGLGANGASRVVFADVTVLGVESTMPESGDNDGTGSGLPFTGADIGWMVAFGLLLVLVGSVLASRTERRRAARRIRRQPA